MKTTSCSFRLGIWTWVTAVLLCLVGCSQMHTYDLDEVDGIEHFVGPPKARELLARNGFVVSDPFFKQIFEPYVESPLPVFITPDSVWHTYHVLLEEGVKQLERVQAGRLAEFSRLLLAHLRRQSAKDGSEIEDLVWYASIGLALQDRQFCETLATEEMEVVKTLKSGVGEVRPLIGFPLSAVNFRAASFYTASQDLADYFSARQWYSTVVFRLRNDHETRLAFRLAALIQADPKLSNLWFQLTRHYDRLVASAEDGDVRIYSEVLNKVAGSDPTEPTLATRLDALRQELDALLPEPRVNDQLLQPDEYAQFGKVIKGFRLFPPRQLPCAVAFHRTTDPAIPGRMYPSGLDFFVASPTLRSPAAVRALELEAGKKVAEAVMRVNCEPLPDSLHGEAMKLLATLQKPLLSEAPPALRTEAWSDLQLWAQLGAWAEQRHTWALHAKLSIMYLGGAAAPPGIVAPYPEFFSGLAKLANDTARALEDAGLAQPFSAPLVATQLLEQLRLWTEFHQAVEKRELDEEELIKGYERTSQFARFFERYLRQRSTDTNTLRDWRKREEKAMAELDALAKQIIETGAATPEGTETLKQFANAGYNIPVMLREFASVCERLTALANKQLRGEVLDESDAGFIRGYGATLAKFHFYEGNSYLVPHDDFPIVTRVFLNPLRGGVLYAGLARPQALYVIVPKSGGLQLYRGAVMTYREFVRDAATPLDDDSWREVIVNGAAPPPPPFTQSFLAEGEPKELLGLIRNGLKRVRSMRWDKSSYTENYLERERLEQIAQMVGARATTKDFSDILDLIRDLRSDEDAYIAEALAPALARAATSNDVPKLIALLTEIKIRSPGWPDDVLPSLALAVSKTPWEGFQKQLAQLLGHKDVDVREAAAYVLSSKPEAIEMETLISQLGTASPETCALICRLLSLIATNQLAHQALLGALQDPNPGIRLEALTAVYSAKLRDAETARAVIQRLDDTNLWVATAAALAIGKLGFTEAAPMLLAKLEASQKSPPVSDAEWQQHASATSIRQEASSLWPDQQDDLVPIWRKWRGSEDHAVAQRINLMRVLQLPSLRFASPPPLTLQWAAIESLSELNYGPAVEVILRELGGDNHEDAARALRKLAPERLERAVWEIALDRNAPALKRGLAMTTIAEFSNKDRAKELLPVLDETTVLLPASEHQPTNWRLCDHAAVTMARLLGWDIQVKYYYEQGWREELIKKLRTLFSPQSKE